MKIRGYDGAAARIKCTDYAKVPSGVSWQSAPAAAIKTRNIPEIHSPAVLYGKAKSVISTRAWLQADIDKAAEWKSKTVAGWWADMQKVASFKGKAAEVTVGEMTDEVPVADLVNQAFEDMGKKKAEEKNVFGSLDTADSGPELQGNTQISDTTFPGISRCDELLQQRYCLITPLSIGCPLVLPVLIKLPPPAMRHSIETLVPSHAIQPDPLRPGLVNNVVQANDPFVSPDVWMPVSHCLDGVILPPQGIPLVLEEEGKKVLVGKHEV
ncbi:hypothetical protein HG531_008906 [Fusarium graminearum]|nr:hypothetical protein HG531_008906 [Fusarium graminearum]